MNECKPGDTQSSLRVTLSGNETKFSKPPSESPARDSEAPSGISGKSKSLNQLVGEGKRFMAYGM